MKPLVILPIKAASKPRLLATVRQLGKVIEALPEPVCIIIEKTGLLTRVWEHLATLEAMTDPAKAATSALGLLKRVLGR